LVLRGFNLQTDLSIATLETFKRKEVSFNIFLSDTGTCAASLENLMK
jgi:hypothetical protein